MHKVSAHLVKQHDTRKYTQVAVRKSGDKTERERVSKRDRSFSWTSDYLAVVIFFSSRRRHTRCSRDWSSDVCSSDLEVVLGTGGHNRPYRFHLYSSDVRKIKQGRGIRKRRRQGVCVTCSQAMEERRILGRLLVKRKRDDKIMIDADPTTHHPRGLAVRLPGEAKPGLEIQIFGLEKRINLR